MIQNKNIKTLIKNKQRLSKKDLIIIQEDPEIQNAQKEFNLNIYDVIFHLRNDTVFTKHICPTCNKEIHLKNGDHILHFPIYCSRYCSNHSIEHGKQIKKALANLTEDDKVKSNQKRKETTLEKYGVEYITQSVVSKEKAKQTCLKKYGTERACQSEEVKTKIKQVNLEKYGYTTSLQHPDIKEKARQTKLAKYGTENIMECKEIKDKLKQTILDRYGVANVMQNPKIKAKGVLQERKRVYARMCELAKQEKIVPLFTLEEFKGTSASNMYTWQCEVCGNIIEQSYASSRIPICRKCHPLSISSGQSELIEFVKSNLNSEYNLVVNTKEIIPPLELDIYIPELKLAFEFNGDYWHSDKCRKDKTYHITKTRLCELKNIKLIHIWEYQWKNPSLQRKIKNRIKYLLGKTERIYARNCTVKRIDTKTIVANFLDENHLQGSINSKVNLGLYNKDQLVALMTFGKPRFNKNYQWELLRFASSKQVVGGASKLLKAFEKEYKPNSLISYANYAWGNGNLYQQLGFSFIELSDPSYVWVKTRDTYQYVYTRYQTQKHKLKDLLGKDNFDPNKSETDNMLDNGFLKLYDCGNLVFVKEYC